MAFATGQEGVSIVFVGDASQLKAASQEAAAAVATAAESFNDVGHAGRTAGGHVSWFTDILKEHKSEMRQESGLARVLARDLSALGLDAKGAGGEIASMLSAFTVGGGIGIALAGIGMIGKYFKEAGAESQKWTEDTEANIKKIIASTDELRRKLLGISDSTEQWNTDQRLLAEKTAELKKLEDDRQAAFEAASTGDDAALVAQLAVTAVSTESAKNRIDLLKREIEALEKKRDLEHGLGNARDIKTSTLEGEEGQASKTLKEREKLAEEASRAAHARDLEDARQTIQVFEWEQKYLEKIRQEENRQAAASARDAMQEALKEEEIKNRQIIEANRVLNRELKKQEEEEKRELEKRAREYDRFAQRIGDSLGDMFTGAKTPLEEYRALADDLLKTVLKNAVKLVLGHAGPAAAGAAESVSAIPIIGPLLAGSQMASMLAMVTGLVGTIPSAASGFDVPAGMSGIMRYHEKEMMLPKEHADTIRSLKGLADSGGSSQPIIIQAMDAQSFHAYAKKNSRTIMSVARGAARDGK